MTNYEMVELLRQKANVSYEEAKAALEASDWDLLDAIVLLEREGKVPENDARFSTRAADSLCASVADPAHHHLADAGTHDHRPLLRPALLAARRPSHQ